jgi:hypothetical protein
MPSSQQTTDSTWRPLMAAKNLFFQVPEEILNIGLLYFCFYVFLTTQYCFEYLVKQINNRCSFQSVQDDQSSYISFTSTDSRVSGCLQLISLAFIFLTFVRSTFPHDNRNE